MAKIMGIINVTPDSFWSGSRVQDRQTLVERVRLMVSQGADAIDLGGCSTRPGSVPVSGEEEMERLQWGLDIIRDSFPDLIVSVDTFRPQIARRCVDDWGVSIINDVYGGYDEMYRTVAETGACYVLSFSEECVKDPVGEMISFFADRIPQMENAGVDVSERVILDPGFGFGKNLEQNYEILAGMDRLQEFGLPVMAGVSRKSMAFRLLDITPKESLNATTVLNTLSLLRGAEWLRVHDVLEAVQVVKLFGMYNGFLV